jgi:hypothetical protein
MSRDSCRLLQTGNLISIPGLEKNHLGRYEILGILGAGDKTRQSTIQVDSSLKYTSN